MTHKEKGYDELDAMREDVDALGKAMGLTSSPERKAGTEKRGFRPGTGGVRKQSGSEVRGKIDKHRKDK
jgi:hypothetical protein